MTKKIDPTKDPKERFATWEYADALRGDSGRSTPIRSPSLHLRVLRRGCIRRLWRRHRPLSLSAICDLAGRVEE